MVRGPGSCSKRCGVYGEGRYGGWEAPRQKEGARARVAPPGPRAARTAPTRPRTAPTGALDRAHARAPALDAAAAAVDASAPSRLRSRPRTQALMHARRRTSHYTPSVESEFAPASTTSPSTTT